MNRLLALGMGVAAVALAAGAVTAPAAGAAETAQVSVIHGIPKTTVNVFVDHDAAAPAVDVRADGKVAFAGLTTRRRPRPTCRPAPSRRTWCSPAPARWRSARPS